MIAGSTQADLRESPDAPRGRFVDAAGRRVYVEEWGTGPALLCVHGLGGGTHFFSALGRALAGRCRTIALDLPGAGLSPPIEAFTFDVAATLLVDLARQEQAFPACLVGHSLGTIAALEAIRLAPDLASGFLTVGGLPEPLPGARVRLAARIDEIRARGMVGQGARVAAANTSARTQRERPDLMALFSKLFELQPADGYLATAQALTDWHRRPLPRLDVPCLAVTGEEDLYAPPDAVRAFASTLPPRTEVVTMADCGHLPFFEQPVAFAEVVGQFMRRLFPAAHSNV
jgi:3-oxoadipate enol-lactonase